MGKASINSCDQGRASIIYLREQNHLLQAMAQMEADMAAMDAAIAIREAQILDMEAQLADYVAQIDAQVSAYGTCLITYGPEPSAEAKNAKPPPPPWPCAGMAEIIKKNQQSAAGASAQLYQARHAVAEIKAQKKALGERYVIYRNERDLPNVMDVWVADWTEGDENPPAASVTGTIEVWGMRYASDTCGVPRRKIILCPQYDPTERPYKADADFGITGPMNSESAMVFSHLATWEWVQEHRPRYITAKILTLDHASGRATVIRTVPVGLDAIEGVSYVWTASDVPITYRDCGSLAFRVGDRVVVAFSGPNKANPVIIGFEDHPRNCKFEGWIIGPQVAGPTSVIRNEISGEWSAGPAVFGGYTSWWHNNGEVVSWGGSPRRYWGVPADSRTLYLRGVPYAIPTSRGFVRGACVRKIGGVRYIYVISADRSARKDYLFRMAIATETSFTELAAWDWETDEISAVTNTYATHIYDGWQKQGHVVAFNPAGTAAVTLRGYSPDSYKMVQYAIGETSGTRSVTDPPHTKRNATSEGDVGIEGVEFATAFVDSDVTIAVDYGPNGNLVDMRHAQNYHFVWEHGATWSLTGRERLICGSTELVFNDAAVVDMPYDQGIALTQRSLQLEQVDLRLANPLITYAVYEEEPPPYGTSLGLTNPYEGVTREVRTIQGLADDAAENTRLWTSASWPPDGGIPGTGLEINIEGRVDWTVADAATGPQGNYIVNAMTSSHLACMTDGGTLQFTGTCSNLSMFDIALLTGKTAPFQNYGFVAL